MRELARRRRLLEVDQRDAELVGLRAQEQLFAHEAQLEQDAAQIAAYFLLLLLRPRPQFRSRTLTSCILTP